MQDLQDNSSDNIFNEKTISTLQFVQLLIAIKDENVVFMNRNEELSKQVAELTEENRKLDQDNIYLQDRNTVLEHAFSAVLQQNNYMRNEWQQVKYPDRRTRSDMKVKEVRDITAENRFTPLLGEEMEKKTWNLRITLHPISLPHKGLSEDSHKNKKEEDNAQRKIILVRKIMQ